MQVLVFLAEGFEEVEALTVVDYLRRKDIKVDMVSITDDKNVKGAHDIVVTTDKRLSNIDDVYKYHGAIIPGGMPGATNLRDNAKVIDIIERLNDKNRMIAAICAGPIVLKRANIIDGIEVTSYPGFEQELEGGIYKEEPVVRDGNIITARGPAFAVDFAIEIIDYLLGHEKAAELKEDILYKG